MGFFFKREDPKTILQGLEQAQKLLDDRLEKKQVSLDVYQKQSLSFRKQREKYEKKMKKQGI